MKRAITVAIALSAMAMPAALAVAGAQPRRARALAVAASTLTQTGRDVTWSLTMKAPFSPAHLAGDRQSICLVFERASGVQVSRVCVAGPAHGRRAPRVTVAHNSRRGWRPAAVVAATLSRGSNRTLTATFLPAVAGLAYVPVHWQVVTTAGGPGCPTAAGCEQSFPSHPAVAALHVPHLVGCTATGPAWVGRGPAGTRAVALTFDDGPWTDTSKFLDVLEREHVPATFFEIGRQIATYGHGGAIERRMLADGDMIGDHTWNHADVARAGSFAEGEIAQTAAAIRTATHGFVPCLFRAPYGDVSPALIRLARSMGFTVIQWDVDPRDWATPGVSSIYDNVIAHAHNGAIIIQHDGGGDRSQTLAALPLEIEQLRREGYQFETVTQMLGEQLIYK
jgi:peptidoglycan/xylan/chitin deacetylase (PgdA/CDA1 family)